MPFPRTEVEGISLPRMLPGINWFMGYSHQTSARDNFLKRYQTRKRIADILAVFVAAGIDAVYGVVDEWTKLLDAIKDVEDRTGRKITTLAVPTLEVGDSQEDLDANARILDSHAAEQVADWLQEQHVPLLAIAAVLPFLVGLITGITVAFVGVAFPLLLGLMMGMDSHLKLSYLVFAYAWGFTGVLISPVHVCLVATLEYFQADLTKTYRWLIPASVGVLVGATGMHLLLRFGLG